MRRKDKDKDADVEPMYEDQALLIVDDEDLAHYMLLLFTDPPTEYIN